MDVKKWEAFLSDPELKSNQNYRNQHNGAYLFGKISHDVLACLNNYLAVLSLMRSQDVEVRKETLDWFGAKKGVVETAVTKIYSLLEQTEGLPEASRNWPSDIKVLGSKLSSIQKFVDKFQEIDLSDTSVEKNLVTMATANLRGVQAIYRDVQAENYKQLLTTKYHD
ncbi:MAG: hypothetical protein H6654_14730 [Ardenticatenaceae bacterium]|nr:hypothetical protein [Anaerolineales bacterium]MCB8939055.1 hypothetical protein [Ardenticatenaceae bacterium]MCB8974811.1 hypothetical protein [Ardenticatenaceae bacterium]